MTGFVLSPAAQGDLDSIWVYSVEEWGESQAERYVRGIEAACRGLAAGTLSSRSAEDARAGYRKVLVGSHVLFFRMLDGGTIDVVRILHQRMDVPLHLPSGGR